LAEIIHSIPSIGNRSNWFCPDTTFLLIGCSRQVDPVFAVLLGCALENRILEQDL